MRTLLFAAAALAGWFFLLRPWLSNRREKNPEVPRNFRGQEVQDADFEEIDSREDEKERP